MTKPLNPYVASVTIEAETLEDAERVLAERLGYDEDYGFFYTLEYNDPQPVNEDPYKTKEILEFPNGITIDASIIRDILEWKMELVDEHDDLGKRLIYAYNHIVSMSDADLNTLIASTDDKYTWEQFHVMCDRILDYVVDTVVGTNPA